ncbi:ergosterol biosynthesis ERG4/ERG24 [Halteromyces radiatus]|uniref:ergosterol biosynthesis ERG4/ERG24 n=1 Tax=Halteromyces radiatus TaxID=101107 RepID=UPI00221E6681|nr:ergosterol biosynthesis ERG4/ERG24 [Halteromyces radiatus]KAI8099699.1 ergosterol biosynthesis ERG4/ERG24 [Halteromyces radiatus]
METRSSSRASRKSSSRTSGDKKKTTKGKQQSTSRTAIKRTDKEWALLNPKTKNYEFGGPLGAFAMVTCLPLLVLLFAFGCDDTGYTPLQRGYQVLYDMATLKYDYNTIISTLISWNPLSLLCYVIFVAHLVTFTISLPGEDVEGTELRDGSRLKYRINGLSVFQTTLTMAILTANTQGLTLPLWVVDHFGHFAVASLIVAYCISILVYISSFYGQKLLALGGNTGNALYDFTIGRELNPRIQTFDIKFFTELRPGLIAWFLLNICMAFKQYHILEGRVTNSMILVVLFQGLYILDALWNESSILSTRDIISDGFGFMLAFGNFCFVPMMYTLQARYLADFPLDLSYWMVPIIVALEVGGYYIFRSANNQKDIFRQHPDDPRNEDLEYITTNEGTRLLISGWWAKARHINYLGDLMMSLAWSLSCGFSSWVPYFYPIYLIILLIHRQRRDDAKCHEKYGKDWELYCEKVPYKIIPGVY